MTNKELQEVFFEIVSKERALELFKEDEVYILWDDLSESLVETETDITSNPTESFGIELSDTIREAKKANALILLCDQLERIQKDKDVDSIPEVVTALNYLEGLGI